MIGNLAVSLTMQTAAFEKGARNAEKRAATLQSKMAGIGNSIKAIGAGLAVGAAAGAVAGITAIAKNAFEMGSALTEAAGKVGVTVEALQEMRFVAEQNGTSIETMEKSLNKMTKTLGSLQMGNKATAETFKALGLSAQQMVGLSPTESFIKIVDALGKIEDETVRAALGNQIFGRSYAELKNVVDLGADGIRRAADEKRRDGVLSTEQAAKLDDLADGWDRLSSKVGVAAAQFIANAASSKNASEGLDRMGDSVGGLLSELGQLFGMLGKVELAFRKFGRLVDERRRDSALTRFIPGMAEDAQNDINRNNARIQQLESNGGGRRGVRGGTGRAPVARPSGAAGGVLAGTMAGVGAGALATLDKLEQKAKDIDVKTATPVKKAVDKIKLAFKELSDDALPLLDRLFPEVKALLDYKADQNTLEKWAKAGKISADQLTESLIRLRDSYYGADGPVAVTQDGGLIENITESLPDLVDVGKTTADKLKAQNVQIVKSFADTARDVTSSITGLANSIKGGGIVGILEGVANLFLSLGGAGVFGSKLQTRLNAPVGRARGGNMTSNRSYLVGERGPEIFTMGGRGGYMTANNDIGGAGRAARVEIIPSPFFNVVVDGRADGRVATAAPGIATAAASGVQTNMRQAQFRSLP
jgi:hypothetical protein